MLTIRKATAADAIEAWNIRADSVLAACINHYPSETLSYWIEGTPGEKWTKLVEHGFYVIEDANLIVGTGMLTPANGQIDAIFVRPSHMGGGVGRLMLDYLESQVKTHGISMMRLDSTLNAAPFYRRCGWSGDEISVYKSPRGIDLACVPMTKRVAAQGQVIRGSTPTAS